MRKLEQHELNEVSGAGFFSDVGALLDNGINQVSTLMRGNTVESAPASVRREVGNVIESTFMSLVGMFGSLFQRN